jgi:hypothetical protein
MPAISSDSHLARDPAIENNSQVVDSELENLSSQAANQSRSKISQDNGGEMSGSESLGDIANPLRQKQHQRGTTKRPAFEELPYRSKEDPKGSAWGLWGPEDEIGTLNYLTPDVISHASKEIKTGIVVPLK